MDLGQMTGHVKMALAALLAAIMVAMAPQTALAQEVEPAAEETVVETPGGYTPMAPTEGKGMPTAFEDDALASMTFQDQYSADGKFALWMHDVILMPIISVISIFVLLLLLYVVVRYNRRTNPVPSKTTHNTMIEVVWTVVPVIILVIIAVPSISLLARQYETPPEDAITVKAIGYQWYWGYEYPDHGGFEVISNMQTEEQAEANGEPYLLAVDNRMVVPAGVPLRIQTVAADVIHAFSVPSLWFKMDAVPGRLNESLLTIEEPGVYYGQCSELCGAKHGYMPIAVEALPMEEFEAWVAEQPGGSLPSDDSAADEGEADAADAEAGE